MSKNSKIKIIVAFFVVLMIVLIYVKFQREMNTKNLAEAKLASIFEPINSFNTAKISKYIVYGTHLNIEGKIEIPKISCISKYSTHIVMKDLENQEESLDTDFKYKDGVLSFSTIENINTGLSLEKLSSEKYYIFLKVIFSNGEEKYYSLKNDTKYGDITYYTLTKENSNTKVDISFSNYNDIPFMGIINTKIESLPDNIYDIAIDASHGGSDNGAKSGKYTESDLVMQCAKDLKKKLETSGYKVFLTRDGSESANANLSDVYAENGRINKAQDSHSKLLISLNINEAKSTKGGVEVYAPTQCDLTFSKLVADNIVKTAKTSYSSLKSSFKKDNGVYVRNFTNIDILGYKSSAKLHNYEPYNITNSTTYLYMLREIGGIATNAFIDGRNKSYGKNKYFDSNIGIEGYSIELGYMKVDKDLNNIVKNYSLYAKAIADAIIEFYK